MNEQTRSGVAHGMLGTLRSELDDAPDLNPPFLALEAAFQSVRLAYSEGRITSEYAAGLMRDLRLEGSDGSTWTIGATSTRWYRRQGDNPWQLSSGPEGVSLRGEAPQWIAEGIMDRILAGAAAPSRPAPSAPVIIATPATVVASASPSVVAGGRDDADWLFSEWESAPTPLPIGGSAVAVGSLTLPEDVPTSWQPDTGLDQVIGNLTGPTLAPVERASARTADAFDDETDLDADMYGTAGADRVRLPEEYFLPNDDAPRSN